MSFEGVRTKRRNKKMERRLVIAQIFFDENLSFSLAVKE
jgi:hypothetical protein